MKYSLHFPMDNLKENDIKDTMVKVKLHMRLNYGKNCNLIESNKKLWNFSHLSGLAGKVLDMSIADIVVFAGDYLADPKTKLEFDIARHYGKRVLCIGELDYLDDIIDTIR